MCVSNTIKVLEVRFKTMVLSDGFIWWFYFAGAAKLQAQRVSEAYRGSESAVARPGFGSIRDIPMSVKVLLTNPTFMFLNLAGASEGTLNVSNPLRPFGRFRRKNFAGFVESIKKGFGEITKTCQIMSKKKTKTESAKWSKNLICAISLIFEVFFIENRNHHFQLQFSSQTWAHCMSDETFRPCGLQALVRQTKVLGRNQPKLRLWDWFLKLAS